MSLITEQQAIMLLADMVRDLGYKAEVKSNGLIRTAMSGRSVLVFYTHEYAIQMYFGISFSPELQADPEKINSFNEQFRFVKVYVGDDALRFEADFFFQVEDVNAKNDLELIFNTWEGSMSFAQKLISELRVQTAS